MALRVAPKDPQVLLALGLFSEALATSGARRSDRLARLHAAAAIGDLDRARFLEGELSPLCPAERRKLATYVAPFDPHWALALLPAIDAAERAACALAAGDFKAAAEAVATDKQSQQLQYLRGAVAAWLGDWAGAREAINRAFVADGLSPPLDLSLDTPTTIAAFGGANRRPRSGGPLVSVVMALRNGEDTLRVAAMSILNQTWNNLELLIVDDGSSDGGPEVALALAREDPRVRLLSNTRSPGAYGARNVGIASARGGFIALQDADDWAHPQRLERQMDVLGTTKSLTVCRHMRVDLQGRPVCPRVYPFVRLSPITLLIRGSALASVGLFEEVASGADSELLARCDERFGRRAAPRANEVGLIARWAPHSLSAADETGILGSGLKHRVAYVESWRRRHAASGKSLDSLHPAVATANTA